MNDLETITKELIYCVLEGDIDCTGVDKQPILVNDEKFTFNMYREHFAPGMLVTGQTVYTVTVTSKYISNDE